MVLKVFKAPKVVKALKEQVEIMVHRVFKVFKEQVETMGLKVFKEPMDYKAFKD
jgi:hypothetical protein